jgi:hypothetical protein
MTFLPTFMAVGFDALLAGWFTHRQTTQPGTSWGRSRR